MINPGIRNSLKLFISRRKLRFLLPSFTTTLREIPGGYAPFHFRHGTTDKYVIQEVILGEQYGVIHTDQPIKTIVDAGANIGTNSVYFLNRFPDSKVISLEPAEDNFKVLSQNVAYYAERCLLC